MDDIYIIPLLLAIFYAFMDDIHQYKPFPPKLKSLSYPYLMLFKDFLLQKVNLLRFT